MKRLRPISAALAISLASLAGCKSSGAATGPTRYPKPIPTAVTGPVIFSPGYVSSGLGERDAAFALDGEVFAFTQLAGRDGTIVLLEAGVPTIAPFSGVHSDLEPFFDPRGGGLWFASNRPHPADEDRNDWNIWRVREVDGGWGEPEIVRGLDGPGDEFYPTLALDGTVAFTATREGGFGGEDIWLATPAADGGWDVENAGPGVNGPGSEFNALIVPDGRMLIFSSIRADVAGDQGGGDLYASTRASTAPVDVAGSDTELGDDTEQATDGEDAPPVEEFFVLEAGTEWTFGDAVLLEPYNSPALDYCPAVTPDGVYLVFTSQRRIDPKVRTRETFPEMRKRLTGPGNGRDDLWWALMPTIRDTP